MSTSVVPSERLILEPERVIAPIEEETLVVDHRGEVRPSQFVEQKLVGMLKASPILLSQMQRRMKPGR
ncbi:MAG TPA: hypothetical protein VM597_03290 [Gemmataceae bacterium]|jgi:hypothetical protein|nr:hypothetical protein [Gemmataceae bacterium]